MHILEQPYPIDLSMLAIKAEESALIEKEGRKALYLKNGQAQIPDLVLQDACVEVRIYAEGPSYPGIFFRHTDEQNFELAYPVPHASGLWDALQYDPVMNGSNTWQNFYGPAYQLKEEVPYKRWFKLKVNFVGEKAAVSLENRKPLVVARLAFDPQAGGLGLWTYLPVWFADLRVLPPEDIPAELAVKAEKPTGVLDGWFSEEGQFLACEGNGVLNINRFFQSGKKSVILSRKFSLAVESSVDFDLGFSDRIVFETGRQRDFQRREPLQGLCGPQPAGLYRAGDQAGFGALCSR